MKQTELFLGLDVHKDSITAVVAEGGRGGEVRHLGKFANDLHALERLIAKLRGPNKRVVHVCYEAGPCGFVIARRLKQLGVDCVVVAPSLIPRKPGDQVKTDRRDAEKLARGLRAGDLEAIYVPDPTDEAIRDLCRARTDAVDDRNRARHRLKSFLLRHGYRYSGCASWSAAHMRYLRELVLPHPAMKVIMEDYLCAVDAAGERVQRCEQGMEELLTDWQLRPAVEALKAFKGFQIVAAMIVVSELGFIPRFTHPRRLMDYLGLVPRESTSSDKRRQGPITKCGNPHVRWLLVECSQHYVTPPKVSKELSRRQEGTDRRTKEVSWRAQNRLHSRFKKLLGRKLPRNKAVVAVARELAAFIWELLHELPCYLLKRPEQFPVEELPVEGEPAAAPAPSVTLLGARGSRAFKGKAGINSPEARSRCA